MMRLINSKLDLERLECEATALLFIEAEWSIYAVRAKNIIESLECELNNAVPIYSSNLEGKDNLVGNWLQSKDNQEKSIFPNVACGAGSILWLINGRIVDFTLNTEKLGKQTLAKQMTDFFKIAYKI